MPRSSAIAVEMDKDKASLAPAAAKDDAPTVEAPPTGVPRAARESEVPVPRSSETRADRAAGIGRARDATSDSVVRPPSRHTH